MHISPFFWTRKTRRFPQILPFGPQPRLSPGSDGFLQMVSELALPGATSTRPWVSHLWRKQDCELVLFSLVPAALGTRGVGMARRT